MGNARLLFISLSLGIKRYPGLCLLVLWEVTMGNRAEKVEISQSSAHRTSASIRTSIPYLFHPHRAHAATALTFSTISNDILQTVGNTPTCSMAFDTTEQSLLILVFGRLIICLLPPPSSLHEISYQNFLMGESPS